MQTVAVVGAAGFVGKSVAAAVLASPLYRLVTVVRGQNLDEALEGSDFVVHCANPAGRFQANHDPDRDHQETVEKTAMILAAANNRKCLLVSSLSCRTQTSTPYGTHRLECERLALQAGAVVVRLGPMFGGGRVKDTLHDILAGRRVFVADSTCYGYVDVAWAGEKLLDFFSADSATYEIGAKNSISLGEIAERFSSPSTFSGPDDTQVAEGCETGPDARMVLAFAEKEMRRIGEWSTSASPA
jgi:nucleoside-diphosphate-sugar epimerase